MKPNPLLQKLGFAEDDRLVIIHVDDVGMCQASLQAFKDLWEFGTISSGAVMVPCAWFPATAAWCRQHPEVDLGVHATLNAEWDGYRWGPISTRDPASGLLDAEGYFHQQQAVAEQQADPEAVYHEIQAQYQRARQAGVDVTHIDTHMGTITHPRFIASYLQTLTQAQVPGMIPRLDASGLMELGMDAESASTSAILIQQLEEQGFPMVDKVDYLPLDDPEGHIEIAKKILSELPVGITHFLMHPAIDTPELRAIAPDWPSRVANYQALMSRELKDFIQNNGIQVIGYRPIRELMRR